MSFFINAASFSIFFSHSRTVETAALSASRASESIQIRIRIVNILNTDLFDNTVLINLDDQQALKRLPLDA